MTELTPKYETARTRRWRAKSDLDEEDRRTITHVEQSGCSVVQIQRSDSDVGWGYTLGIFDTCPWGAIAKCSETWSASFALLTRSG